MSEENKHQEESTSEENEFRIEFKELKNIERRKLTYLIKKMLMNDNYDFDVEIDFMDLIGPGTYYIDNKKNKEHKFEIGDSNSDGWNYNVNMIDCVCGLLYEHMYGDKKK